MSVACPHCDAVSTYRYRSRAIFKCAECARQFSDISNSLWRNSKLPAVQRNAVEALAREGARPIRIERETGVSYKTAWRAVQLFGGRDAEV